MVMCLVYIKEIIGSIPISFTFKMKRKLKKEKQQTPQKKATCLRLLTISPKKPNSANRKIGKVIVSDKQVQLNVKIPGEGHTLQQHSTILLRPGRVRDLIGINNIAIRGKFDLSGVIGRKTSRSVYGVKIL